MPTLITRRKAIGTMIAAGALRGAPPANTRQATGIRIGEVTPTSAVISTRRTTGTFRLADGVVRKRAGPKAQPPKPDENINGFEGACPGAAGAARLSLEPVSGRGRRRTLGWIDVGPDTDFTHQFRIDGLSPGTQYRLAVETRGAASRRDDDALSAEFRTAPAEASREPIRFALSSCQIYHLMDRPNGFAIYSAIEKRRPAFLLSCGDNVYYDSEDPVANSVAAARYHWQRMYSLPTLHSCLRAVPGYWQKDDHDLYTDDGWPGRDNPRMLPFNFEQGPRLFREQTPSPPREQPIYRRFRWGADLEIFLPIRGITGRLTTYPTARGKPSGEIRRSDGCKMRCETARRDGSSLLIRIRSSAPITPAKATTTPIPPLPPRVWSFAGG